MAEGDHAWAANHLPQVHYAEDVIFPSDSTLESVACLFENGEFTNGDFVYERRTLWIIIQEQLYPLKSLANVKDIGQVLLDVACGECIPSAFQLLFTYPVLVHRWLYNHPGILHRDLSFNNIMYRLIEEMKANGEKEHKVYGVLTDYNLSSWKKDLGTDYTKTSQQRTGTPPYMAQELLKGTSTTHLYRHDLESLFCVMLMMGGRHEIGHTVDEASEEAGCRVVMREGKLPYAEWFNVRNYASLGKYKSAFFLDMEPIELSPVFEGFRPWLQDLQYCFSEGFKLQPAPNKWARPPWMPAVTATGGQPVAVQFDDETLGGFIHYGTVLAPVRYLTGELKGLIIRDPKSPSIPAA